MLTDAAFDFSGTYLPSAYLDQVFLSVDDEDIAFLGDVADIAAVDPFTIRVNRENLLVGFVIA